MLGSRRGGVHLHAHSTGEDKLHPLRVIIRWRLLKTVPIHGDNYNIFSSKDAFLFLPLYQ
jgi:hypothetical protein